MSTVYISGPLTGIRNIGVLKTFYEQVGTVISGAGLNPYIPHLHSDPVLNSELSPQAVYALDRSKIVQAALIVAYVGIPALGVGQEIEIANQSCKPVILLYDEGSTVTRMVRGNPAVIDEVIGTNLYELLQNFELSLGRWLEQITYHRSKTLNIEKNSNQRNEQI